MDRKKTLAFIKEKVQRLNLEQLRELNEFLDQLQDHSKNPEHGKVPDQKEIERGR